ncbi:oxidoreductase [Pseudomaricurvus alkylphenolicus]|uniref:4Fe-4S dicluster domain-containing protein n=1 Tax=Pseudomaricurvus alkylphenolicus TaxID=1306991 RepID=UPI001420A108|nr:4Fe-4S dicluster domain-containing protein [Pseudomaricurvus alkylphenolicus]NIB43392.1 oxidoreductase [Pseudomaricurvus alkylphenolicus]
MQKWNLIIDVAKCENCHNCTLSSKDEHEGNDFPGYAAAQPRHGAEWIKIKRRVRGEGTMVEANYQPTMCNHCDDAPCLAAGVDGAVRKRDDGIVIIDPDKAKGRKDLVETCPYNAIHWNEELQLPQVWIFDAHLLDQGWKAPRCQQSCPTKAIEAVKITDGQMNARVAREKLRVLRPEFEAKPRVYYKNLHLMDTEFLGGSVQCRINDQIECIEGAEVKLLRDNCELAKVMTDVFGDFKFDGLEPGSKDYTLKVSHPSYGSASVTADLPNSRYIDNILLEP